MADSASAIGSLVSPRQRTSYGDEWFIPSTGMQAGRLPRLCRSCGEYGAWHGSNYCCCQCRDTDGRVHGLWCSQNCPGPGVANSTTAKLSSFTLASKVDDNIADPCRSEVTATLSAPRKRTPPGKAWCVPCAGTEAGRPARLCRACGEHGAWHGSSYCCCQCRDTDGRVHGLWCSQDCPGPGVANCTRAKVSPFTLAAQDPELLLLRPRARPLSRGTASQHIRCRDEVQREEASLEALFRHRFGWRDPEQGGRSASSYGCDDCFDA